MRLLFFAISLSIGFCEAQMLTLPVDSSTMKITYKTVGKLPMDKDRIYLKSKDWATETFPNYKAVAQVEDKELGKLRLNGATRVGDYYSYILDYQATINCRDSAYSFTITDIRRIYNSGVFPAEGDYFHHRENVDRRNEIRSKGLADSNKKIKKELSVLDRVVPEWQKETEDIDFAIRSLIQSFEKWVKK